MFPPQKFTKPLFFFVTRFNSRHGEVASICCYTISETQSVPDTLRFAG